MKIATIKAECDVGVCKNKATQIAIVVGQGISFSHANIVLCEKHYNRLKQIHQQNEPNDKSKALIVSYDEWLQLLKEAEAEAKKG